MRVGRAIAIAIGSFLVCGVLHPIDTTLINSVFVEALAILNSAGVALVLFLVQGIPGVADATIKRLNALLPLNGMAPLTPEAELEVRAQFEQAINDCGNDAKALIVLLCFVIAVATGAHASFAGISWPSWLPLTKLQVAHGMCLSAMALSAWCVMDILLATLCLAKLSGSDASALQRLFNTHAGKEDCTK